MKISPTYIKQAYSLAWRFFRKNILVSILAILVITGLYVLSMIPILGLVLSLVAGIALFSVQTYVAKTLMQSKSDEEFDEMVANTKTSELLTKYMAVGSGGVLGFLVIEIAAVIVLVTMVIFTIGLDVLTSLSDGTMSPDQKMQTLYSIGIVGIVFMIVAMLFAYVYPLVVGKVYATNDFKSAFKAMFSMFSPSVWKASLNGQYFFMILVLHLSAFLMVILMIITMSTIILAPLALLVVYLFILYSTTTAVIAKEIALGSDDLHEDAIAVE